LGGAALVHANDIIKFRSTLFPKVAFPKAEPLAAAAASGISVQKQVSLAFRVR
jgi:hypothetical protein